MTISQKISVPPLALDREYRSLSEELDARVKKTLSKGHYILGEEVASFQKSFAAWVGMPYAVGVASGTDALYLALRALHIGEGDEVITVPFTYFATVEGIVRTGARPVFVDIDPATYVMDVTEIEKRITLKTKAILPVHLYGQCVGMDSLLALAKKYHLAVVEDVAQAHGALYGGKKAGSFGELGCFSFYPTKNLGAYGDGGAVTVKTEELYKRLTELRVHGTPSTDKYFHQEFAANSRLDEVQAAILSVKLPHLNGWIKKRQEIARAYNEAFQSEKSWLKTPFVAQNCSHVYHQYTVRTPHRDALKQFLTESGIAVSVYYPHPIHLLPPLKSYGYQAGDFPETEVAAREVLSLPCFPQMTDEEISYTITRVKVFQKTL